MQEVKERDLFYLFWSRDAIEPQPLVPPQVAPPSEELKDLHFNDAYILIRKAIEHGSID